MWKIAAGLGWVPKSATRDTAYEHLNRMVPDACKFDLHVLLVEHGKVRGLGRGEFDSCSLIVAAFFFCYHRVDTQKVLWNTDLSEVSMLFQLDGLLLRRYA